MILCRSSVRSAFQDVFVRLGTARLVSMCVQDDRDEGIKRTRGFIRVHRDHRRTSVHAAYIAVERADIYYVFATGSPHNISCRGNWISENVRKHISLGEGTMRGHCVHQVERHFYGTSRLFLARLIALLLLITQHRIAVSFFLYTRNN